MQKHALVIGATGLLGYGVTLELNKTGWEVRAMGRENLVDSSIFPPEIEYLCGDFYDESFLIDCLYGIDKVFFFLSSTFPSTSIDSLELEITQTVRGLDYLLRKMKEAKVYDIIFPSSGGTVYGNIKTGKAKETDRLKPVTPYGVGKKLCEEILRFYSLQGISATILRIGNVYGTPMIRTKAQGVIDVFIQKALMGEKITIWGNAMNDVRDYIFVDDFAEAVAKVAEIEANGVEILNLSSEEETTLGQIVDVIKKDLETEITTTESDNQSAAAISRMVLDNSKIRARIDWKPQHTIETGIQETIRRKKENL